MAANGPGLPMIGYRMRPKVVAHCSRVFVARPATFVRPRFVLPALLQKVTAWLICRPPRLQARCVFES